MSYYQVQMVVARKGNGVNSQILAQVPTFSLDSDVLGVVNLEQATRIARSIVEKINPDLLYCSITVMNEKGNIYSREWSK